MDLSEQLKSDKGENCLLLCPVIILEYFFPRIIFLVICLLTDSPLVTEYKMLNCFSSYCFKYWSRGFLTFLQNMMVFINRCFVNGLCVNSVSYSFCLTWNCTLSSHRPVSLCLTSLTYLY